MIHLVLSVAWLTMGIALFIWAALDPERNARMPGLNMQFLGGGALLLSLYNLVRWRLGREPKKTDWVGRRFPPGKPPKVVEYNPDLDFSRSRDDREASGPASGPAG